MGDQERFWDAKGRAVTIVQTTHAFELRHDHDEPSSLERCFYCGKKATEHNERDRLLRSLGN